MRVGIDATPLLGTRTGIGRYVEGLLAGFAELDPPPELVLTSFSLRGRLPGRAAPRRLPARLLVPTWNRLDLPPVELLTGRVDVFHGTNYLLPPTRRAAGVLTVHDLSYLRHAGTVTAASLRYRTLVPRGLRRARAVLVDSAVVGEEVVAEYGVDREQLVVAPLGVGPEWFEPQPRPAGLPERYLLFVGSREPRKNLPVLLDAYRSLVDPPPLVLAGPPGWGPALDVSGVVTPGYLDDAALRAVVAGAAALVFPSRYEGFGLPPLEALAAGTPVVASDLPVLREVLGDHAAYAPPGDPDALATAIEKVLAAPPGPTPGRAHAATFTWRRCVEQTLRAYELALRTA